MLGEVRSTPQLLFLILYARSLSPSSAFQEHNTRGVHTHADQGTHIHKVMHTLWIHFPHCCFPSLEALNKQTPITCLCEFKVSLAYIVSSRIARDIEKRPCLKTKQKNNKQTTCKQTHKGGGDIGL